MNNNMEFIKSIKIESDFEKFIKAYVQKIFNANCYLIGGPWDNGKDLVTKVRGREIRTALQISIQENKIESKIDDDIKKITKLVDEHNYPPVLYFFWSHPISEHKLDKIRTKALKEYSISLEFFDAKRIADDITTNFPELLNFLIKDIHHIDISIDEPLDIRQKAFYEYLLLSKDSTNLKNSIIDANIISNLYTGPKNLDEIHTQLNGINIKIKSLKGRLDGLIRNKKLNISENKYMLSQIENLRIQNLILRDSERKSHVVEIIKNELKKYTDDDFSNEVFELITKAYEESLNVQIAESKYEPPKLQIFNSTIQRLKQLIKEKCNLSTDDTDTLANVLMDRSSENEYLSEHCSAKLCVSLLADSKLERYIENKKFFIYLDAPVLIPYLVTLMFDDKSLFDRSISNINLMKEHIYSIKNKEIRVSSEHFEETTRHLEQAEKLSTFVTEDLIKQLGESKNIYFNTYMKWKSKQVSGTNFDDFLLFFIGIEKDEKLFGSRFNQLSIFIYETLKNSGLNIINYEDRIEHSRLETIKRKYRVATHTNRAARSIENDIICTEILRDDTLHLDENGVLSTPMLITLDSSQYQLRTIIRSVDKFAEWLVYTPQRAIERLSLINLKISSEALKDGVLATISDEYFFKDNTSSLIDTLSLIISETTASKPDLIKLVTTLKRKVNDEAIDPNEIDIEQYNNISYVLLYTHKEFKNQFERIVKVFKEDMYQERITQLLLNAIKSEFGVNEKEKYNNELQSLLNELNSSIDVSSQP